MDTLCLTDREAQLTLLREVCERRDPARVAVGRRGARSALTVQTRFRFLGEDYLLLEWPNRSAGLAESIVGANLEVFFKWADERLAFRAQSCGRIAILDHKNRSIPVWKLALPATIVKRQQRDAYRVPVSDLKPIPARLTATAEEPVEFDCKLHNVSAGGMACIAPSAVSGIIHEGDVLRATFELPEIEGCFEVLLQVMHLRELREQASVFLGCSFCPGDDPVAYRDHLRRIEQFIAQRQRARLKRARDQGRLGD